MQVDHFTDGQTGALSQGLQVDTCLGGVVDWQHHSATFDSGWRGHIAKDVPHAPRYACVVGAQRVIENQYRGIGGHQIDKVLAHDILDGAGGGLDTSGSLSIHDVSKIDH